jgi:polysaccharide pyruvyl transferase WcaK-like protein
VTVLAPFGFYGWGNIGDESTLQGFARLVSQHSRPLDVWVASRNSVHTARVEPSFRYYPAESPGLRGRWASHRARAQVIAGGTPIMDGLGDWPLSELVPLVQSSVRARRPMVFVGVGVETLHHERSRRLVREELAPNIAHWSVRSERDRTRLLDLAVPEARVTPAADMAWLLPPVDAEFGRKILDRLAPSSAKGPVIGVNLNLERAMASVQPRLTSIVAQALDRSIDALDARVVFLCNEVREGDTFDKATAGRTMADMTRRDRAVLVPNDYYAPQEMLSLIACCDMTVSSRYHFCLFSAIQGVPFLALNRSDKVEDLCLDLQAEAAIPLAGLDADDLYNRVARLHENRLALRPLLAEQAARLHDRARANLTALDALTP